LPLLKANLKQSRLPTILAECEKLAREAAESNQTYEEYLLRLTELSRCEWIAKHSNTCFIGAPGTGKPRPTQYPACHRGM